MVSNNGTSEKEREDAHRNDIREALETCVDKQVCVSWSAIPNKPTGEATCVTMNGTLQQHPDDPWTFRCVGKQATSFSYFRVEDVVCMDPRKHELDSSFLHEFKASPITVEAIISIYKLVDPVEALTSLIVDDVKAVIDLLGNDSNNNKKDKE